MENGCNGNDGGELEEEFGQGPWVEMLQDLDLSGRRMPQGEGGVM